MGMSSSWQGGCNKIIWVSPLNLHSIYPLNSSPKLPNYFLSPLLHFYFISAHFLYYFLFSVYQRPFRLLVVPSRFGSANHRPPGHSASIKASFLSQIRRMVAVLAVTRTAGLRRWIAMQPLVPNPLLRCA